MSEKPLTPLLDKTQSPDDLKALSREELRTVADELRAEVIDAVSVTGGHLGAGLGVNGDRKKERQHNLLLHSFHAGTC